MECHIPYKPGVRVYLDDHPQPIIDQELPTNVSIDTRTLEDGAHRLKIRAQDHNGREGVEEIPFQVHNGPGIVVSGLGPYSIRRGAVRFTVDAFSTDDPFDPRRAEARSSIPVWVWSCHFSSSRGRSGTRRACGMCLQSMRRRRLTLPSR